MSKNRKRGPQNENSPDHPENPPNEAATIHTVKIQPNPEDQQRSANEQEYWQKQVQQAKRLNIISTLATAIALAALLGVGYNACLIHRQVAEMQKANAINTESFEATERPWLSVKVAPAGDLYFVKGKQAALAIKVSIKNVGKSIAKDVQIDAKLSPSPPGLPMALNAAQTEAELCNNPRPARIGWFYLFPTDSPAERTLDISAIPSAIAKQSVTSLGVRRRTFVGLYVVGCVTYRFSFGAEVHQTRFAYQLIGPPTTPLGRKPLILPNGMLAMPGTFEIGAKVPEKRLHLMQELTAPNDAN